jgi:hypothetical protein
LVKRNSRALVALVAALCANCGGDSGSDSSDSDKIVQVTSARKRPPTSPTPTPTPPPSGTTDIGLAGEAPIPSEFDITTQLVPAWGTGAIPISEVGNVGAFRFICMPGHLSNDDPIVFPRQPGAAHLHQFFGNTKADAYSTYRSLRTSGDSTCMSPLNRSAYWMPAMLDGVGHVVRPDYVSIYYKRRPSSDPTCDPATSDQAVGKCVDLPNGLNFVFGFDWVNPANSPTGTYYFNCTGPTGIQGHYPDIETAAAYCPIGNRLGAVINAPNCWDGKSLSSPDGRSHIAYADYGNWGYSRCPTSHPYVIPSFTMGAWYTVDENLKSWYLSSDHMNPGGKRGSSFHADFMMAWDPEAKAMWHRHCIDRLLNCSGGDLGNGKQIKQAWPFSWTANPRLAQAPVGTR